MKHHNGITIITIAIASVAIAVTMLLTSCTPTVRTTRIQVIAIQPHTAKNVAAVSVVYAPNGPVTVVGDTYQLLIDNQSIEEQLAIGGVYDVTLSCQANCYIIAINRALGR